MIKLLRAVTAAALLIGSLVSGTVTGSADTGGRRTYTSAAAGDQCRDERNCRGGSEATILQGMENVPERQHPNARLRASDEDRDRVVDVLRDSLMAGRLTQEEHAERLEATLMAKTLGELEPITEDLVVPEHRPTPGTALSKVPIEVPARPEDSFESLVGIFGGGERKGRWRVKRRTNVTVIFGGYDLDMTDAVFEGREVVIWTFALFGGVDVTVPDGVEVRNLGSGIFGGYGAEGSEKPDPNAPVVVMKGLAIFGGVGGQTASKRRGRKKKPHGGH